MRRLSRAVAPAIMLGVWAAPSLALAWNSAGHRVIASIAYRQLDDATRKKVADLLKSHPAYADLWADRRGNGPDPALNLFWNASVFPDDARGEPWRRYNRAAAHFVNYRVMAGPGGGNAVEPPLRGENVINSYVAHLRKVRNPRAPDSERALSLSWVFHQAGDVHQPLHAVARFSKALPEGDRGGNGVQVPDPRGRREFPGNLHAYWDNLLGGDDSPANVERLADEVTAAHPASAFAAERAKTDIGDWAQESVKLALSTAYRDLDPEVTRFPELPAAYEAEAKAAATRRVALAGYRLADELKRLFGE